MSSFPFFSVVNLSKKEVPKGGNIVLKFSDSSEGQEV